MPKGFGLEHRRSIIVLGDEEKINPVFSVTYLPDRLFTIRFLLHTSERWTEAFPRALEERRVPYWWPTEYSQAVHDLEDPLVLLRVILSRISPEEGPPLSEENYFGESIRVRVDEQSFTEVWNQEKTQVLVGRYFANLESSLK